ncbi:M23 family metallopeptidase [Devosia sp. LjRoot16]|uniref:M23 family metallopeptidase n=1 Tax=Devosia sp. LjRoot16 TaxID=3342271 RepID=UPI003ED0E202
MNPAQRNRTAALLKASGFEDGPALTVQSTDGEIPHGRELSFAWLTGTVMTGLTSVLLMGAALYVSFEGQDTFSTAYEALQLITKTDEATVDSQVKGDRVRPVAKTRSELEIVEASIRETVDGRSLISKKPFVRVRATLATAATALSNDIPDYDPVAMIDASQPVVADGDDVANPEIYGAEVEGEVQIKTAALPASFVPAPAISDKSASDFVRATVENLFAEGGGEGEVALAYAQPDTGVRDLGVVTDGGLSGVAENVSILPKTKLAEDAGLGRSERVVTIRETGALKEPLLKNGFDNQTYDMISATLKNVLSSANVPSGARLRILMGPARNSQTLIPHRLSIYFPDPKTGEIKHAATAALTDRGSYVLGLEPPKIEFPEEDTEEINVNNLPSVYRSIWETARKHDIDDAITSRIVAMFAYDIDLTKRISAGDSIEILETEKDATGHQDLLYVALKLGTTTRELFRFRTDDGTVDFYDPDGETGKRFLTRRPLQGGGRLASRFGNRVHPIFKSRRMHTGVDLASKTGTPIYASGDGMVEKAGWASGYGKKVEIKHVNGFETGYGHMSRIADGMKPGVRVRQGQIIGYVGSTGNSTGPHLHFEIKVNGRFVDPLSVKLPRDKSLSAQYEGNFEQTISQIRDLMKRDAAPMTVAALN